MTSTARTAQVQSKNPRTGEVLATFERDSDEAIETYLAAADATFRNWRGAPVAERAQVSRRIADLLVERTDELARLATLEMGKPIAESVEEVGFAVDIFRYYADHAEKLLADEPLEVFSGKQAYMQKLPLGVLLGVMPWNFPYYQAARFIAPNLVLGNTVVLKHAESVSQCAVAIQQVIDDAGAPEGFYRNLFVSHDQIADIIIPDPRVQGVSLTGSERAGAAVASVAGKYLKKCVLELGGSDPYIVLDSADVTQAAKDAWAARIYNTGQACNSNKRIIVHEDIFDAFVSGLVEQATGLKPGDPMVETEGTYAPMSSRAAAEEVHEQLADAVSKGATLHVGGELGEGTSSYISPAVLTGVTKDMRAYREEIFGPVAVVYSVSSDEEAIRLANDSDYGLGGAVFSQDEDRARALAARLDTGMANVNLFAGEGPEVPFGGIKRSGFGRELGPLGIDEFANKRLFYIN